MSDLRSTFEFYYSEGSIGPGSGVLRGQCVVFAQSLVEVPQLGNTIQTKKAACRKSGTLRKDVKEFLPGDVLVLDVGTKAGHVAVVSSTDQKRLNLSESNWKLDLKVHHTRWILASSSQIYGIFRGKLKVAVINSPPVTVSYPIQIQTRILMNKQPLWQSLLKRLADIQDWYFKNSSGKIQLILDYKDTDFSGWPTVYTGGGIGTKTEIIKEDWYDANVLPVFPKAQALAFVMRKADFGGGVDAPNQLEVGYCYPPHQIGAATLPIKTFMALDEGTDYPPSHPQLFGLSKYFCHELAHGLYQLCASDNFPTGTDLVHEHFYGLGGYPRRPEDIFNDFDYEKLSRIINK